MSDTTKREFPVRVIICRNEMRNYLEYDYFKGKATEQFLLLPNAYPTKTGMEEKDHESEGEDDEYLSCEEHNFAMSAKDEEIKELKDRLEDMHDGEGWYKTEIARLKKVLSETRQYLKHKGSCEVKQHNFPTAYPIESDCTCGLKELKEQSEE